MTWFSGAEDDGLLIVQHTRIKSPPIGRYGPHLSPIGAMTMARMRHERTFVAGDSRDRFPWISRTFAKRIGWL
ncbi:hypothetical protein CQW49_08195 [Methylosinus trichosporium OB3b]|uniref:Uncharacterized protein n=1 Tax=Methylosinus trichosporium (strain ATCC 35070 / NCIMB 11131 / UNIQEM 75 / OB3b) TaxID=595536 RepID=A0A2D2CYR1_METT3|nr:hypothetical protein CQW49_08195 [Methylosinus trichosporium OB3b]OBS50699.1 hypothetical protein A8B73_20080 [Methylosinus sp. 3S-1]